VAQVELTEERKGGGDGRGAESYDRKNDKNEIWKRLGAIRVQLTLFYTCGLEIVVLHVVVTQPCRFSPCFLT
jgi:hypothetical protein